MDCKFKTELGLVTVNDEVLVRVAGYAALDCYGIVGMAAPTLQDGIAKILPANRLRRGGKNAFDTYTALNEEYIDLPFRACAEAVEEAILNSLAAAETTIGYTGEKKVALCDLMPEARNE